MAGDINVITLNIGTIFDALDLARTSKETEIKTKIDEIKASKDPDTTQQMELSKLVNEWQIYMGAQTNTVKALADGIRNCYQNIK